VNIKQTVLFSTLFAVLAALPARAYAQVAHVDPDSGALSETAPAGTSAALREAAPVDAPAQPGEVVASPVAGGGVMMRLDRRFAAVAVTSPDTAGLATECVPASKAAAITRAAGTEGTTRGGEEGK